MNGWFGGKGLIVVILIAIFLRFWNLDKVPSGPHSDEADMGYAAYSILKTGLTQYGNFNPLAFPQFDGGTFPPLNTYIHIPLIYLFGLNIIVERLPSVLFSILTIPIIYFLVKKLFDSDAVALIAAFLFAVNPWSVFTARQGLLESTPVFLVSLGTLTFLYGKKRNYFYIISAFALGLSVHANDAAKIFVPVFLLPLGLYSWKNLLKSKKYILLFIAIFAICYLLVFKSLFIDGQINDFRKVSSFSSSSLTHLVNDERRYTNAPLWLSSIFHNKLTTLGKYYLSNYSKALSLNWLFIDGHGNLLEAIGRHGQFYLFELPFFFIGIYLTFKRYRRVGFLLLSWLLLAVIPAAITINPTSPYRLILVLPIPIIFSAIGIVFFWSWSKKFSHVAIHVQVLFLLIASSYIASYFFTYFFDYPVYGSEWRYKERNQAINYAASLANGYDRVFVNGGIEWAVMYAFNTKVSPTTFQQSFKHRGEYKDVDVINIGKFSFGAFDIRKIATASAYFSKNSLVVVDADLLPETLSLKQFYGADPLRIVYKVIEVK